MGKVDGCQVENKLNITLRQEAMVESASGMEVKGKSNDDVINLVAEKRNIKFFPRNLEIVFKNLKRINLANNQIKEFYQEDLKSLPNLMYLRLDSNQIDILEEGLFKFNSELVYISIERNNISYIAENAFSNLNKLAYLHLQSNPCIDTFASNDRNAVLEIIRHASTKCIIPDMTMLTNFNALSKKMVKLEHTINTNAEELKKVILSLYDLNNQEELKSELIKVIMSLRDDGSQGGTSRVFGAVKTLILICSSCLCLLNIFTMIKIMFGIK